VDIKDTGGSIIPLPDTLPSSPVTQPKRTFTTVRTPKDIASENSISRYMARRSPVGD
jgi:CAP-Gly domain-containing linker protein 3/4